MLVKAGVIAGAAAASLLALSPMAFAHDSDDGDGGLINVSDVAAQVPVQLCNNSIVEGTLGVLASHQRNDDSHDGDCHQRNSAEDNRGGDHDWDDD